MKQITTILLILALAACSSDKYTETPKASGPWVPANLDPESRDNNIVPLPVAHQIRAAR